MKWTYYSNTTYKWGGHLHINKSGLRLSSQDWHHFRAHRCYITLEECSFLKQYAKLDDVKMDHWINLLWLGTTGLTRVYSGAHLVQPVRYPSGEVLSDYLGFLGGPIQPVLVSLRTKIWTPDESLLSKTGTWNPFENI